MFFKGIDVFLSFRRLWPLLVCTVFASLIFSVFSSVVFAQSSEQKVERLSKDIRDLNHSFKKAQERLTSLSKQVEHFSSPHISEKESPLSWWTHFIEKLTHHIKVRFQEFIQGLEDLAQLIQSPCPDHFSLQILRLLISASFGCIGVYIGHFFIRLRMERLLSHLHSKRLEPLNKIAIVLGALALPLASFFLLSMSVLFLFEGIQSVPSLSRLYSQQYALLPMDIYVLWAGFSSIRLIFSPKNPALALLPLTAYGSKEASFWMHVSLLTYFFGKITLYLFEIFPNNTSIVMMLATSLGLLIAFSFSRALRLMMAQGLQYPSCIQTVRGLNFLHWTVFLLCGLWLLSHRWFHHFLIPILVTHFVIAMHTPLQNLLASARMHYLWKCRHTTTFLKTFLKRNHFLEKSLIVLVYGVLFFVWSVYLWDFYDFKWFFSVIHGIQSILFSPFAGNLFNAITIFFFAVLFVKIGERILSYYVEDKYPSESGENNFLASRLKTLMAMLRTLLRIVVWLPAISIIFSQFGEINITAWITSIGAASFGLTFGFQSIVRDFITGFFIILENNLMVGDEVDVDGRVGKVEEISLRTLKIREDTGTLLTIPFGNIMVIGNKNRLFSAVLMNVSIGYYENIDQVQSLIEKAFGILKRTPILGRRVLGNLELRGIKEVTSYSIVMQIKIKTAPNMQESIHRSFTRILKQVFDEANIAVPTPPHAVQRSEPSLTHTIV